MIDDARTIPADSVLTADLCIVGCGAAGITIGRELAGSSLGVVILESGGLEYESEINDLDKGEVVGLPYFPLDTARLRYFGGSTNHWGGVCRPLEPIDFEARDWIPGSGWPIARADLDPYYLRAAATVGLQVADWDLARWSAKSAFPVWPFAANDPIETVVAEVVDGDDRSFTRRYRSTIEAATNVTVHLHANAISIDTDANGLSDSYGSLLACDISEPVAVDSALPAAGDGYFYLVGAANVIGKGPLGFASNGLPRLLTSVNPICP